MDKEKITREIAEGDVNRWLDTKKVLPSTRRLYEDFIESMIDGVMGGILIIEEDCKIKHTLVFPVGSSEEAKVTSLTYFFRLNSKMLKPHLNGVKANDGDGRMDAHIAALTNTSREIIAAMDATTDKKLANAIALFFS